MDIKYLGHSAFHIKGKTDSVVCDPFDPKMVGLSFPKIEAGIITISHQHQDHNFVQAVTGATLTLDIPGEYEKQGIRINGYPSFHDNKKGEERGGNTLFRIEVDGVSILHCGDLGHTLDDEIIEEIGSVAVLLVPVGGHYTIDAAKASAVVAAIEPSIVVPMHYKTAKHDSSFEEMAELSVFLKEMGVAEVEPVKKLTLKKEDTEAAEMKVVVMDAS